MADKTSNPNNAAVDANKYPSLTVVSGTAGTSDVNGTAEIMRIGGDPTTGAAYVYNLGPAGQTTVAPNLPVIAGTPSDPGTPITVRLTDGTTYYNAGATTVGTFNNITTGTQQTLGTVGTLVGLGTITNLGSVTNLGTVKEVTLVPTLTTVTTVSNLTNGSANILTGTLQSSGTTTGVGVVSSVSELVKGTVTNLVSGTINALASGTITNGTVSVTTGTVVLNTGTITTIAAGTLNTLGTVGNLNNGSVNLLTGTVTSLTNLAAGTVQINPTPVPTTLTFGTLGVASGSFFGTLSAASGAGTKHYVSGVDIVMQAGTADVRVLAGSAIQGTGVLAAGQFPPGGGISNKQDPAFATGTNSELIYHFVGAGTAFIRVSYWKGV